MNTDIVSLEAQACGCKTTQYKDGQSSYEPCLPCAVKTAGLMLVEAGKRMQEERQAPDPAPMSDHIDGNKA